MTGTDRDLLERLAGEMLRIQKLTGIAPTQPEQPVYPQFHAPRLEEAKRQLKSLGYRVRENVREGIFEFEAEAGLPRLGNLTHRVWNALQELRDDDTPVEPTRWRAGPKRWKAPIRRAIRARTQEIGVGAPLSFADNDDDEAPPDEEASFELEAFSVYLQRELPEPVLVQTLLSREALPAARDDDELAFLGLEGQPDEDDEGGEDELEGPLVFGLVDRVRSLKQLFSSVIHRPEYRKPPAPESDEGLLPQLADLLERRVDGFEDRWSSFVDRPTHVWQHLGRARSWLHGATSVLDEAGDKLESGLADLIGRGAERIKRVGRYGRAAFTNMFRVLYHNLVRLFEDVHTAMAFLVNDRPGAKFPNVRFVRRPSGLIAVVGRDTNHVAIQKFIDVSTIKNRMWLLACEALGYVLQIFLKSGFGVLAAGPAILKLARLAPQVLGLMREFSSLAARNVATAGP